MYLPVFLCVVLVVSFERVSGTVEPGECHREKVYCPDSGRCVPRVGFRCGNKSCDGNKKLCGSPDVMRCVTIDEECHRDSVPGGAEQEAGSDVASDFSPGGDFNPFSHGFHDNRGFNSNEDRQRSGESDSELRRVIERNFHRLILEDIGGTDNRTADGNEECSKRYSPCIKKFLRKLVFLKALDGHCCRMAMEPEGFSDMNDTWTPFGRDCPRGQKFCPLSLNFVNNGCIHKGTNCSCDREFFDRNATEEHWTPWGRKCPKGFRFSKLAVSCVPKAKQSPCETLVQWMEDRNASNATFGKVCLAESKFCLYSMNCESEAEECDSMKLSRWASSVLCNSSQQLCLSCGIECKGKEESCPIQRNDMASLREAVRSLQPRIRDEVMHNLSRSGWASFCRVRKFLVSRVLHGLKACLSRDSHCRLKGYESHKTCVSGERFCQNFVQSSRRFSSELHRCCNLLKTNVSQFERVVKGLQRKPGEGFCPIGSVFCPLSMSCVGDIDNCSRGQQLFRERMDNAPWEQDRTYADGKTFCTIFMSRVPEGKCSLKTLLDWLKRNDTSVTPFGDRCPAGRSFTLSSMNCSTAQEREAKRAERDEVDCADGLKFCRKQQACLSEQLDACTDLSYFDYFSVSPLANKTGYADLCHVRLSLSSLWEDGYQQCDKFLFLRNATCSAQTSCAGDKQFCRWFGSCVPEGNCSRKPQPSGQWAYGGGSSTECDSSYPELLMLGPGEPLNKLFAPGKAPEYVALFNISQGGENLQYKSPDGEWENYEKCYPRRKVLAISTNSKLRVSSCLHGFLSFQIVSVSGKVWHALCVDFPESPDVSDTVAMVIFPSLHDLVKGLDITVLRPEIIMREDHRTELNQVANYVNLTSRSRDCREIQLDRSIACRVSEEFRSRYEKELRRRRDKLFGVAIKEIYPPRKVAIKCQRSSDRRVVDAGAFSFIALERTCWMYPGKDAIGEVTIKLVPACRIPAELVQDIDDTMRTLGLRKEEFEDFPKMIESGYVEDVIDRIISLLQVEKERKKERWIRNIVRSFIPFMTDDEGKRCVSVSNSDCFYGRSEVEITALIQDDNDRPGFNHDRALFVNLPVPYEVSDASARCVSVSVILNSNPKLLARLIKERKGERALRQMLSGIAVTEGRSPSESLAFDKDGDSLGLVVVKASHAWFGQWVVQINGSEFQIIPLSAGTALFLKPGDCIAFNANKTAVWSLRDSWEMTKLVFRAWDCTNDKESGYHTLSDSDVKNQTSFSDETRTMIAVKLGCDNYPGSKLEKDLCGVCLGEDSERNSCVGCDGVLHSNKTLDCEKVCVSPEEKRLPCSGSCFQPSYRDQECGKCRYNDSDPINHKDCEGVCDGPAMWSDCNSDVCVGGTTGLPLNYLRDACGTCGGDNSSCSDCDGVPNGPKKWDSCDKCRHPDSKDFDSCPKIIRSKPEILFRNITTIIELTVVGFQRKVSCSKLRLRNDERHVLTFERIANTDKRTILMKTSVDIDKGEYTLACSMDDSSDEIEFAKKIKVYDQPTITEASPNETAAANSAPDVTLFGRGFVNSSDLTCVMFNRRQPEFLKFKARFESEERVTCPSPRGLKAEEYKISLLFSPGTDFIARSIAVKFVIYRFAPKPKGGRFNRFRYGGIVIEFDGPAECLIKSPRCEDLFNPLSVSKFGSKSKCHCKNNGLIVKFLDPSFSLRPSDHVVVVLRHIGWKSAYTKHQTELQEETVSVLGPKEVIAFTLELTGPSKAGPCDSIVLSVRPKRGIHFEWSTGFADLVSPSAQQTTKLDELNEKLKRLSANQSEVKLSKEDLLADVVYNFTVYGEDHITGVQAYDSHLFTRVSTPVPEVRLPKHEIEVNPAASLTLRAIVKASSCLKGDQRSLVYLWTCNKPGVVFESDKPAPTVNNDQWVAGQIYKFELTVYSKHDDSKFSRVTLTVKTKTEDLRAIISGGKSRTLGVNQEAVCDASGSEDPNNLPDDPVFVWSCACKRDGEWRTCTYRNKTTNSLERVNLPLRPVARIPPGILPGNTMCKVTVNFIRGDKNAKASVLYHVKNELPTTVKILKVRKVNSNQKAVLPAFVSSAKSKLKLEWSCVQVDDQGNTTDIDLDQEDLLLTPRVRIVEKSEAADRILLKETLVFGSLRDGMDRTCRLTASDEEGASFSEETLQVNEPPEEGLVDVSSDGRTYSATGVGFEDEDEPLTYRCACRIGEGKKRKLRPITSPSMSGKCEEMYLPPGDPEDDHKLSCFMEVSDVHNAKSRVWFKVQVPVRTASAEEISNATYDVANALESDDMPKAIGKLSALISSNKSKEGDAAMKSLTEKCIDAMLSLDAGTKEEKFQAMQVLEVSLEASDEIDSGTKEEIAKKARNMYSQKSSEDRESKRMRRSADEDDEEAADEVEAMTAEEVETALSVFSYIVEPGNYSNSSMVVKQGLIPLVEELGRSMCQDLSMGEPAVVAKSDLVVLRSDKNNFEDIDTNFTEVTCFNCSDVIQVSAQVLLGQSLKERYEAWDCDEDGCNGACVVSAQYPFDLLVAFENGSVESDVVFVKLFNPESLAPLLVSGLVEPVTYRIPLVNYTAKNDTMPQCYKWDHSYLIWTTKDVTTAEISLDENGNVFVDCKSSSLGFISIFSVNSSSIPSTTGSPITTTHPPGQEQPVNIRFKLDEDYDAFITEETKQTFMNEVKQDIAVGMDVNVSRISNLQVSRGSILISFSLLPGETGENNVTMATSLLKRLVESGNFAITLSDGRSLHVDSSSFLFSSSPITKTTTASERPTTRHQEQPSETSSGFSTGTLVGIIVGSILSVVLVIVVVVVVVKMRGGKTKVDYHQETVQDYKGQKNNCFQQEEKPEATEGKHCPMSEVRTEAKLPLPGTPEYPAEKE